MVTKYGQKDSSGKHPQVVYTKINWQSDKTYDNQYNNCKHLLRQSAEIPYFLDQSFFDKMFIDFGIIFDGYVLLLCSICRLPKPPSAKRNNCRFRNALGLKFYRCLMDWGSTLMDLRITLNVLLHISLDARKPSNNICSESRLLISPWCSPLAAPGSNTLTAL